MYMLGELEDEHVVVFENVVWHKGDFLKRPYES
jgi:hypothetical protein